MSHERLWLRRRALSLLGGFVGSAITGSLPRSESAIAKPARSADAERRQSSALASAELSQAGLPVALQAVFEQNHAPDALFVALMPAVVDALQCDRCFLFLRDPQRQLTRITHGYSRYPRRPTMVQTRWNRDSPDLNAKDPLTASAYRSPEAHFIEDIETAAPGTLNLTLERSVFGHRALVHAPIYHQAMFYGVLEPCMFDVPRVWTERDREIILALQQVLGEPVVRYLRDRKWAS
ncbi:MAG: GAF domain-containing protein [Cyanobacteria bacterium J06642_2]